LLNLGQNAADWGNWETAKTLYRDSLVRYRELGHSYWQLYLLLGLGNVSREQGALEDAASYYEQALALAQESGNREEMASSWIGLGYLAAARGDADTAHMAYVRGLALYRDIRLTTGLVRVAVAVVALRASEDWYRAAWQYGAILAVTDSLGDRREPLDRREATALSQLLQTRLNPVMYEQAIIAGRGESLDLILDELETAIVETGGMSE
jgi:tetratricopeptide (TPR) repeat protein